MSMQDSPPSRNDSPAWVGWLLAAITLIVLLLLLLVGSGNWARESTADRAGGNGSTGMSVQSGAVKMPTATPTAASIEPRGGVDGEVVLLPGFRVASISPDGSGTRVYATPSRDSLVMDLYLDGAAFVVLEPTGNSASYPVEAGGLNWYRVRASDGLVGWVMVDRLVPLE